MQLTVVAKIEAKSGSEDLVYQELRNLIAPTQAEDGCINYDLHRSIENPALFLFYENWINRELWEAHMQSAHIKGFEQKTEAAIANWELLLLTLDTAS
ncbi:putative quinol monooxygenase [Chroococcidiopsis sp. CCMEE 29]|uniref:putative quinol monooxygenase n=1 Tax=Chroococcidiopsis sp. CCMEE 29 TaxID=155894 RepID=UPI00202257E0|nr:putative quinol monooxygenase [Chroococcidiopsis sp. CCMEE 29]